MKEFMSKAPIDAASFRIVTGGVIGSAAIVGGMIALPDEYPSEPAQAASMGVETTCTGTPKAVASPNSPDTGVMINLKVNTKNIPSQGTILRFENTRTGESIVAGYYTPDEPIPETLKFSSIIPNKQPDKTTVEQNSLRFHLLPDDGVTVTIQNLLPDGMYLKKEDITPPTDSGGHADLTKIDLPMQGPIIAQSSIEKLCP